LKGDQKTDALTEIRVKTQTFPAVEKVTDSGWDRSLFGSAVCFPTTLKKLYLNSFDQNTI